MGLPVHCPACPKEGVGRKCSRATKVSVLWVSLAVPEAAHRNRASAFWHFFQGSVDFPLVCLYEERKGGEDVVRCGAVQCGGCKEL